MYVRGYLQGSENGRVVTIGIIYRLSKKNVHIKMDTSTMYVL